MRDRRTRGRAALRSGRLYAHRQTRLRRSLAAIVVVLLIFGAAACGGSDETGRQPTDAGGGKISGSITVFAAASLTEAFTKLGSQFEAIHLGTKVTLNFGASSALADQIAQGAPADVLATADNKNMATVRSKGRVDEPMTFAQNRLAIIVGRGNPKRIGALTDLAGPDVAFVLCAVEVPCGKLATEILKRAKVTAKPRSYEENVKAVVTRVTLGEADAGVVYASDVHAAGSKAVGVRIPAHQNTIATYPIAVVKKSTNPSTATAFSEFVRSAAGQRVLTGAGFLPKP